MQISLLKKHPRIITILNGGHYYPDEYVIFIAEVPKCKNCFSNNGSDWSNIASNQLLRFLGWIVPPNPSEEVLVTSDTSNSDHFDDSMFLSFI